MDSETGEAHSLTQIRTDDYWPGHGFEPRNLGSRGCALNHCAEQHHGLEGRNSNIPTVEESTLHIKAQIASEAHGQVDAT